MNPPNYIYPFNNGVYLGQPMSFSGSGGDIAYNDELFFCQDSTCTSTCATFVSYARN